MTLWGRFRGSALWRILKRVSFLRSGYYLAIELQKSWTEPRNSGIEAIDGDFRAKVDPWNYETSSMEQERFAKQTVLLDDVRQGRCFDSGLEIGCAEGLFTEALAERCAALQVLDFSPTALERARSRRQWPDAVRFDAFDLRNDEIPDIYDLVVVAGVLEYFTKPRTFKKIRRRLCAALRPGGILLLETTRVNSIVENAWWARFLIRGRWINDFIGRGAGLAVVSSVSTEDYTITLFRKIETRRAG